MPRGQSSLNIAVVSSGQPFGLTVDLARRAASDEYLQIVLGAMNVTTQWCQQRRSLVLFDLSNAVPLHEWTAEQATKFQNFLGALEFDDELVMSVPGHDDMRWTRETLVGLYAVTFDNVAELQRLSSI